MSWFMLALSKYATFSGRSRRKEYWMFFLFVVLISIALSIVDVVIGTYSEAANVGLLSGIFSLATVIPWLALTARRLHDIGKSGWMQLLYIIPIVGFILWIIWSVKDSDPEPNKYGPNPKLESSPYGSGAMA
jgi:uncharacterized membrane protein YhaH (DUF805 family)